MGNKLCAPLLRKPYRSDENPWNQRKDSHLLRLWAEVFRVRGDGEFMRWERVSEDVVPLNISCIEDTPSTVYHISSYNRQVEKIFDVRITQPGTIICPATECFVHWRDSATRSEWGLNFSNASDARKFRDCCSFPTQRFARKASSASSLRLSPPKKVKGKGTSVSSPNSPLNEAKRSPQESLAPSCKGDHSEKYAPPGIMKGESSSTIPRTRIQVIQDELFDQGNITKPSSNVSVYDNVSSPVLRKPTNQDSRNGVQRKSQPLTQSLIETSFTTKPIAKETPSRSPRPNSAQCVRFKTGSPPYDNKNNHRSSVPINTKISISKPQPLAPAQFTSFGKNASKSSHRTCDLICMETAFVGTVAKTIDHLSVAAGTSRHTSSSESPEWPSPPEPLTPQTPLTPLCSLAFDSDSLKKMLQSLPATDQGFHEDCSVGRPLKRTKSLNVHDRRVRPPPVERQCCVMTPSEQEVFGPQQEQSKYKSKKMCVEYELHLRNKCARDSYPDSGIGGMSNETAGSVWSGDSLRSEHQGKTGMVAQSWVAGSVWSGDSLRSEHQDSANSSAGSRLSDYANILNEDGDVKQFLSVELSDEDGADSDSSIHTMTSDVSYGKQSGAIRKAGWLVVKNWLIHKKRKVELAAKRSWKRYWVCLKGTMLLFFDCAEQATINEETVPRHILVIEGGIAQAVPEHPKRDNIFALSSTFGDAYLFQASSQIELENWIMGIHSACASSFARHHGKDNTLKLLKHEIQKLDTTIDMDVKMKKMADLQLTVVTDPKSRQAIVKQIAQWEENLEKSYIEQYRLRCYAASLQGSELPNPKVLLANASKMTKATLGRIGIFTVTSFHALVSSRNALALNLYGKYSKGGMMSPKSESAPKLKAKTPTRPLSPSQERTVCKTSDGNKRLEKSAESLAKPSPEGATVESLFRIHLPNNQTILVGIDEKMGVQDLLELVCNKRQLNPRDHYLRLKVPNERSTYRLPGRKEVVQSLTYEIIEVCQKSIIQLELRKTATHPDFGLMVEAELAEDYDKDDELRVYISEVRAGSVAETSCIRVGDEILAVGGKVVFDLDMVYMESLLLDSVSLCITIRSCRPHNHSSFIMAHADTYIDHMVCPPPPSQRRLSKKVIENLTVPGPNQENQQSPKRQPAKDLSPSQIDNLLIGAEQVTAICRDSASVPFPRSHDTPLKPLSEAQKLRKVIMELIETEQAYVKDLNCLIERYLEPLKEETFLNPEEIEHLFGNIQEIVLFQRMFLQSLEEGIILEGDFFSAESSQDFRRVLFSLGGSFLYYANQFKVYSSFCASHSRSQKILNPGTGTEVNLGLREFLKARNPKQQHSATLESYLIKPIQRILKYPLLLQQLCNLTDADTDEHYHLEEALKGMEAVAEHINEMQKIYEEYGAIFDCLGHLYREAHPHSKPTDLSVGELQMYGTVEWCNAADCLGKVKKGTEFENAVFVFRSGVVFLCRERARKRKNKGSQLSGKASDTEMVQRYRTLIPVHELQVRGGSMNDTARHHWWELIHSRSDTEGRPQRIYQFCNSTLEAKTDFMKIIRQTIRDSVRKLMVPAVKPATKNAYIPHGEKRMENLPGNPRSIRRKHGSKGTLELERHSMDLEENLANLEYETLFRTRSKTIGDLNEMVLDEGESCAMNPDTDVPKSPSSSNSNLSGSSQSGSAKLMHASASPLNHSSNSINSGGSPIWKPRPDATMPFPQLPTSHPPGMSEQMTTSMNTASAYGDCSDIVYRKETKTVVFVLPEATSDHKGTEC